MKEEKCNTSTARLSDCKSGVIIEVTVMPKDNNKILPSKLRNTMGSRRLLNMSFVFFGIETTRKTQLKCIYGCASK